MTPKLMFIVFLLPLLLVLQGCSNAKRTINSLDDLDYYLGIKDLKDAEQPDENLAEAPLQNTDEGFQQTQLELDNIDGSPAAFFDPALSCLLADDPRFGYRKKVAFIGLDVAQPQQIVDLPSIHKQYPKALINQFNHQNFIVIDATHRRLPQSYPVHLGGKAALIRHMAEELNVQFIVSGVIENAAFHQSNRSQISQLTHSLLGQSHERPRQLDVSLTIYDGTTGAIVDESMYQGDAVDHYKLGNEGVAFSVRYLNDGFGKLALTFLEDQALWLEQNLTCLPMQARVTTVSGSGVSLATGTESLLLPGDQLKLLRRVQLPPVLNNTPKYRFEENGTVVISQVYPNGALASFKGQTPPYQVNQGDIVQAW